MIYLKENDLLKKEIKKIAACDYCDSVGILGVESIHTGSGSDENLLDKLIEYQCPICGKKCNK